MAAITFGMLVVWPATMEPDSQTFATLALNGLTPPQGAVVDHSVCVDVAASRSFCGTQI